MDDKSESVGNNLETLSAPAFASLAGGSVSAGSAAGTPLQTTALPKVDLSISQTTGTEADGTVITITATASSAVSGDQTVDLVVTGTGITTGDFTLSFPTITIANGSKVGSVKFTVVNDPLVELLETATVMISNPSSGITLGTTTSQQITITSDDIEAPSLVVTTTADVVDNMDNLTSLREALALANSATAGNSGTGDADNDGNAVDTIRFDPTVFANGGLIRLNNTLGTLVISSAVNIDGTTPSGGVTITGDTAANDFSSSSGNNLLTDNVRVFHFDGNSDGSSLNRLTITGGYATKGGGVYVENSVLQITDSTIAGNRASNGGGIYNYLSVLNVTGSTFATNYATNNGGGLFSNSDSLSPSGTGRVTNSTFYDNYASNAGGGIFNHSGLLTIQNSTVYGNSASVGGGVGSSGDAATSTTVQSTIIAGNTANTGGYDVSSESLSNATNSFTSEGNNFIGDGEFQATAGTVSFFTDGVNGDIVGTNAALKLAQLGDLSSNGGPTQTLLPQANSPVIGEGFSSPSLLTDQRGAGFARQVGPATDIGAVEAPVEAASLVVTTTLDKVDNTDGLTSLREAINAVNTSTFGPGSTIRFAGDSDLTGADAQLRLNDPSGTKTIFLAAALNDLRLTQSVNIDGDQNGDGTPDITIDADSGVGLNDADSRVFTIDGPAPVTAGLSGLIIRDGATGIFANGGGLSVGIGDTLTLSNSMVMQNTAGDGGGLYVASGSTVSITGSTISNNTARSYGGGVYVYNGVSLTVLESTFSNNRADNDGGGIELRLTPTSISSSLFSGNTARLYGGAIDSLSSALGPDTLQIVNSTFTQNSAHYGGAVFNVNGTTRIEHSTITNNTATVLGGGVASFGDVNTQTYVGSTIIAGNKSTGRGDDVATLNANIPNFTSLGNNLIGDGQDSGFTHFTNSVNNDIVGTTATSLSLTNVFDQIVTRDPDTVPNSGDEFQAGGLADNGGPVQTVALKASLTNPAIDAGGTPPTEQALNLDVDGDGSIETTPISVDARGFARSVDIAAIANTTGPTDIGAFETQSIVTNGPDIFEGTASADTQAPGQGNDLIVSSLGADSLDGGPGADTADYSGSAEGVFVYLSGTDLSGNPIANRGGDAAGDTLANVENLIGSDFRDDLFGDSNANAIYGGGGRDFVFGLGGADSLYGGGSLDFISGVDGGTADYMDGGAGRDVAYYYTANESQVVDMDGHTVAANNSGEHMADTWVNISGFWGAAGYSNTLTGDANANDLIGGEQGDVINGGGGRDQLIGRGGNDTINGGADRDLIIAGSGTDTLTGGTGVDTFYVLTGDGTNIVTDYVEGEDLFFFFRTGVTGFTDLSFTDTGTDVDITSAQDTSFRIVVQNVELTDLDQLDDNGQAITTFGFA